MIAPLKDPLYYYYIEYRVIQDHFYRACMGNPEGRRGCMHRLCGAPVSAFGLHIHGRPRTQDLCCNHAVNALKRGAVADELWRELEHNRSRRNLGHTVRFHGQYRTAG